MQQYITKSAKETQRLGERFAKKLEKGAVLALFGELGSGKTTFVSGLAKGLGIKEKITSASYIIVRQYKSLIHIDLYRLEDKAQIKDLGIDEFIEDKASIVVIEWADRIGDLLPKNCIRVKFRIDGEKDRKILINWG